MPNLPVDPPTPRSVGTILNVGTTPVIGFDLGISEARSRLGQHMSVLQAMGKSELAGLGQLRVGFGGKAGTALQKAGAVLPSSQPVFLPQPQMLNGIAYRSTGPGQYQAITGGAMVLNAQMPAAGAGSKTVPLSIAYWFASEIVLDDNTTVVLAADVKSLVIIAEKLTVGKSVTISWERPALVLPNRPAKPPTPPPYSPDRADGLFAERGRDGTPGVIPATPAPSGQAAPELELWFLTATGFPAIDMRGQDGAQGIRGGDGGDGGPGQHGCNSKAKVFCTQEAGQGGDGGNGGRAGDGGRGGNGGTGGRFSAFAPQAQINAWLQLGLTASVDGGSAGSGGDPGNPGEGGPGGEKGSTQKVCPSNNRTNGARGATGGTGNRGPAGSPGILQTNSIRYSAITTSDFLVETAKPAIVSLAPTASFVGDTVSVNGLRFTTTDRVFIEGMDGAVNVPCPTTFVSESLLTFQVPAVPGGYAMVAVEQGDGTRSSSQGTLTIRPRIDSIVPSGRIRPGEYYFLHGTGLGRDGAIWINGEGASSFQAIDPTTVKFKASRPVNVASNPSGEPAKLRVVNSEGAGAGNPNHSAEIDVVLDTYRILAFGDSVMWGGGLPEHQKFYSLAADYVATIMERIGVYKTVEAHHGAKIGRGDTTVKGKLPGELSTRYPTILQQVDGLSTIPDAADVDLILVDGGANDLPITNFTMQTTPAQLQARIQDLVAKTKQYCYDDMIFLLNKIAAQFPKARIIVTGYYHIFSAESKCPAPVKLFVGLMDGDLDLLEDPSAKLTALCDAWVSNSNARLAEAVNQVNASLPGDVRVFFVNPETQPKNAAFASESFLWEPDELGGPTDPLWEPIRKKQREDNKARLQSEPSNLSFFLANNGYKMSRANSSFHPNPAGARRYFEKMQPVLDQSAKAKRIAIQAQSGHYLCAEGGGGGAWNANRTSIGAWETFELVDLGGNRAALRSVNGRYVCAEGGGGQAVVVDRARRGDWESFTLVPQGAGKFALKTWNGTHYLSATGGGGAGVTATATQPGSSETFRFL